MKRVLSLLCLMFTVIVFSFSQDVKTEKRKTQPGPREKVQQNIAENELSRKRVFIKVDYDMGFSETSVKSSWTETVYHEPANTSISYDIQKGNSMRASVGYLFSGSMAVELGADISPRDIKGSYTATIPHPLLFNQERQAQGSGTYEISENSFFLNFVFTTRFNTFGLDVFAGPALIMAEAQVISEMTVDDTYPFDSVTLNMNTAKISKSVFGFNGGASLLFHFAKSVALYIQGYYLSGTGTFDTGTVVPGPKITLGGFKAGAGLKFLF